MNILLIEDRGSVSLPLAGMLEDLGHQIFPAHNPADADGIWNNRTECPIHCIVADLNMPTDGLTDEEIKTSRGGVLSGWVWLHKRILMGSESEKMRSKIVIFSDYLPDLKENVKESDRQGIPLIAKRASDSIESLLKMIERISKIANNTEAT